jgi:tRNA (cmo5U34)-methyltransferase
MSDFDKSLWSDPGFSREYLDNAEAYVPLRGTMLSILVSFYEYFLRDGSQRRILDLGCGDGIVADVLVASDPKAVVTLVDGSADMLLKAKDRLTGRTGVKFVESSFEQLISGKVLEDQQFDLAVSSLAIHHLDSEEKQDIYGYLFDSLVPGGYLLHMDVVLAPTDELEGWSMVLWQEWIDRQRKAGITDQDFSDITRRYQDNEDNRPDTLAYHLDALNRSGFDQVDCLFKYGTFAVWTGKKPC